MSAVQIVGGTSHTCALLANSQVKCWGKNNYGQLGLGDTATRGDGAGEMGDNLSTVSLGAGRTATQIVAGGYHTCAILDNSKVKCWGHNSFGQLGLSDVNHRGDSASEMGDSLPAVSLGTGRTALQIVAGNYHTCALLDNSQVKCWGYNFDGQLGLGDSNNRGDAPSEMGNSLPAVSLGAGRTAVQIVAGSSHVCALLDNSQVKCWGNGGYGQLGLGDPNVRGDGAGEMGDSLPAVSLGTGRTAVQVVAGTFHTCALLDNAQAKCWGHNGYGQLGLGDVNDRGDGASEMGDSLPTVSLGASRTIVQIVTGNYHTCAILDNFQVKCWGRNNYGQLGLGDVNNRGDGAGEMGDNLPTVSLGSGRIAAQMIAGGYYTCAVLDSSQAKCWGYNSDAQLGLGDVNNRGDGAGEMGDSLPLVNLGSKTNRLVAVKSKFKQIASGDDFTCAVLENSQVKCWGRNADGQLGAGDMADRGDEPNEMGDSLPYVNLGVGRTVVQIATGGMHACAILDNSQVKCWGSNAWGRLGLGNSNNRGDGPNEMGDNLPFVSLGTGRTAVQIAAGNSYTCAILDNSQVKCWGYSQTGQLGLGDTVARGDGANEMGDNLPFVNLGTGRTAVQVVAGRSHTCALLDNSQMKCWGYNFNGQLGLGDTNNRGDGANEMGDNLPLVNLGTGRAAVKIIAGSYYTCALLDNSQVKCWGQNLRGQLGLGDALQRGDEAGEMGDNLPSVSLGTGRTVVQVAAGNSHACALLDNSQVKCWGYNNAGQLGLGDTSTRGDGTGGMGDILPAVSLGTGYSAAKIILSSFSTCVLLDNSQMKCWGTNHLGHLGLGDVNNRGDAANEMGDNLPLVLLGTSR